MTRPAVMRWQRPTFRVRVCKRCGGVAPLEYASTLQCEPDALTVWTPLCWECRNRGKVAGSGERSQGATQGGAQ